MLGDVDGQGPWTSTANPLNVVAVDPTDASNQVLSPAESGGESTAYAGITLAAGDTGTLFGRFYSTGADTNVAFGLSSNAAPTIFNDLQAFYFVFDAEVRGFTPGGALTDSDPVVDNVGAWYNFWLVVDNTAGTGTTQLHIQSDDDGGFATQTSVSGPIPLHENLGLDLASLIIRADASGSGSGNNETVLFDDLYFDAAGINLANPIIPEPSSLALGLIFGLAGLARRRS